MPMLAFVPVLPAIPLLPPVTFATAPPAAMAPPALAAVVLLVELPLQPLNHEPIATAEVANASLQRGVDRLRFTIDVLSLPHISRFRAR